MLLMCIYHCDFIVLFQQVVNQQMKNIQKLANARRQKLMESKHLHEYFRESDELENWVNEQMLMANSEDYGQDYEHLLVNSLLLLL